jgi:hypothetical protein
MKPIIGILAMLALMAGSVRAQVVTPLPPFTVYGTVRHWSGRAFVSSDAATVIAKINGQEMDRCSVMSGLYPSLNYRVRIPMASGPLAGRGQPGDPITFEVYYDGQLHAAPAGQTPPVVGQPGTALRCNLLVGTDVDGDGLPDEYEALLLPYYADAGRGTNITDISPNDDFDEDGYSNLQEFYAGTIPVEGADLPRISDFFQAANGYLALSFLSAPGRTYVLPRSDKLLSNQWTDSELSVTTNEVPTRTFYSSERDAFVTLYLLPAATNAAFFRLEVK